MTLASISPLVFSPFVSSVHNLHLGSLTVQNAAAAAAMNKRTSVKDRLSGAALSPGLLIQTVSIKGVTFNHDLTSTFTAKKRKFAVYSIRIHSFQSVGPRTVDHRFSTFRQLHRDIVNLKTHKHLLTNLTFPSKFTIGSSTSQRVIKQRTVTLTHYLSTVLSRLPVDRETAARDPVCDLIRQFLLIRNTRLGRRFSDPLIKIQAATEALTAQGTASSTNNEQSWKNPLESDHMLNKKCLALTGSTATQLLNAELLKLVQNDPRKNGITSQIKVFVKSIQVEFAKGSPRQVVERVLASRPALMRHMDGAHANGTENASKSGTRERSGSVPTATTSTATSKSNRRMLRAQRSLLSISDARALDQAIEQQEHQAESTHYRYRNSKNLTLPEMTSAIEAKMYERRLQRVCYFAENLYDLLLEDHLHRLMNMLPLTKDQILKKKNSISLGLSGGGRSGGKSGGVGSDAIILIDGDEGEQKIEEEMLPLEKEEEASDPREELVKHIVQDAVELAIYNPLFDVLKYYSTKLESTTDLDTKIVRCINDLNDKYLTQQKNEQTNDVSEQGGEQQQEQLPQSIFHLNLKQYQTGALVCLPFRNVGKRWNKGCKIIRWAELIYRWISGNGRKRCCSARIVCEVTLQIGSAKQMIEIFHFGHIPVVHWHSKFLEQGGTVVFDEVT